MVDLVSKIEAVGIELNVSTCLARILEVLAKEGNYLGEGLTGSEGVMVLVDDQFLEGRPVVLTNLMSILRTNH